MNSMTDAQILVLMVVIMVATSLQATLREADKVADMMPEDRGSECPPGQEPIGLGLGCCSVM